jgi:uncharacterized protein YjdB
MIVKKNIRSVGIFMAVCILLTAMTGVTAFAQSHNEILPTGISLPYTYNEIRPHDSEILTAIVYPANATNNTVTWSWSVVDYNGTSMTDAEAGIEVQTSDNTFFLESTDYVGEVYVTITATTVNGLLATAKLGIYTFS